MELKWRLILCFLKKAGRRGSAQLRAARFKSPTSYSPGTRKYSKKNTSEQTPVNKGKWLLHGMWPYLFSAKMVAIEWFVSAPEVRNQGGEDENLELVYLSYANGSIEHIENAQNEGIRVYLWTVECQMLRTWFIFHSRNIKYSESPLNKTTSISPRWIIKSIARW